MTFNILLIYATIVQWENRDPLPWFAVSGTRSSGYPHVIANVASPSAYLMQRYGITPEQALAQVRETRPFCEPNDGFMKQLQLYYEMATPEDVDQSPAYQRWLYQREVELSRACGIAPEANKIRFEDEHETAISAAEYELRCRKCRYV